VQTLAIVSTNKGDKPWCDECSITIPAQHFGQSSMADYVALSHDAKMDGDEAGGTPIALNPGKLQNGKLPRIGSWARKRECIQPDSQKDYRNKKETSFRCVKVEER